MKKKLTIIILFFSTLSLCQSYDVTYNMVQKANVYNITTNVKCYLYGNKFSSVYEEDFELKKNIVHLWDDETGYSRIPYKRYAYKKSANGQLKALDGTKVEKVTGWKKTDEVDMYESDVRPDVRTLIDRYYESDDISKNHRTMFFDIEVQRDDAKRYSTTKDANNVINSIAYYDTVHKQYTTLILDPAVSKIKLDKKDVGNVFICPDEEQLLMLFIKI